jgi:hypothetical protein
MLRCSGPRSWPESFVLILNYYSRPEHPVCDGPSLISPRSLNAAARFSLVLRSRFFNWREALMIVKPETLIGWHRKGFKLWCGGSRGWEHPGYLSGVPNLGHP